MFVGLVTRRSPVTVLSKRSAATIARLATAHPGDDRSLRGWISQNPEARVRCVLGKTEGNGCVNDFTRGYASHVVEAALGDRHDASIIMSGGTEGVLTPHFLVFAEDPAAATGAAAEEGRLVMGSAKSASPRGLNSCFSTPPHSITPPIFIQPAYLSPTPRSLTSASTFRVSLHHHPGNAARRFEPHELGRRAQVEATRDAVLQACADAGLPPEDVRFAQIKCPLLTPERIARSTSPVATHDGYVSMGLSRAASSLGVALATGEVDAAFVDALAPDESAFDPAWYSGVASASAGIELEHSEVFVIGNAQGSASPLRAVTCVMKDAIDAASVGGMLASAGLETEHGQLTPAARARVRAVLAKADPCASVRGERTTMCSDSDIHATRHSRAAVGGLLCGIFGDTALYVSGGAELQGPEGGGPVCVVYEVA